MKIDINKIKHCADKHAPKKLNPICLAGEVSKVMFLFSDEYQEELKRKHPDWYKKESLQGLFLFTHNLHLL